MSGTLHVADIDTERLSALNSGQVQSRTLTEALAIDQLALLHHVVPNAPAALAEAVAGAQALGILKRMQATGAAFQGLVPTETLQDLAHHPSDTVRGWLCFANAASPGSQSVEPLLARIRPAADDPHFAVREWAWMAARPILAGDLEHSIGLLVPWTASTSEQIRRFASEALRPRGVWARHIAELKLNPGLGLPLLEPLRADNARYVQDSVANWINDAAKTNPDWARDLGRRWDRESPSPATGRITARALRSLS